MRTQLALNMTSATVIVAVVEISFCTNGKQCSYVLKKKEDILDVKNIDSNQTNLLFDGIRCKSSCIMTRHQFIVVHFSHF